MIIDTQRLRTVISQLESTETNKVLNETEFANVLSLQTEREQLIKSIEQLNKLAVELGHLNGVKFFNYDQKTVKQ